MSGWAGLRRGASGGCKRSSRSICRSPSISRISVAQDLAAEIEDASERLPAYYGLWSVSFLRGDLATMQEMAAAFLNDAEKKPLSPEAIIAQRIVGMTRWFEGNFVDARKHLERALADCDAALDQRLVFRFGQDLASPAMAYLALALWPIGKLDRSCRLVGRGVGHPRVGTSRLSHMRMPTLQLSR